MRTESQLMPFTSASWSQTGLKWWTPGLVGAEGRELYSVSPLAPPVNGSDRLGVQMLSRSDKTHRSWCHLSVSCSVQYQNSLYHSDTHSSCFWVPSSLAQKQTKKKKPSECRSVIRSEVNRCLKQWEEARQSHQFCSTTTPHKMPFISLPEVFYRLKMADSRDEDHPAQHITRLAMQHLFFSFHHRK